MAQHHVVCGLGFGDEGKGTIVDYLCHKHRPDYVVRFNGGAQAAHNVVLPDGRHHVFSQFGSGAFWGTSTFLSEHMLVNPLAMNRERRHLVEVGARGLGMFVDERALITTPYHQHLNRSRETAAAHGSCGMGIGETMRLHQQGLSLTVGDTRSEALCQRKLVELWDACGAPIGQLSPSLLAAKYLDWSTAVHITPAGWLKREVADGARLVFEGAQGLLLDERFGWMPHCTWSNTTPVNAMELLRECGGVHSFEIIGVLRAYHTRHGAGPLPTEIPGSVSPTEHNGDNLYQGAFRWGHFDAPLARYALGLVQPDSLALTHLDLQRPDGVFRWCESYQGQEGLRIDPGSAVPVMKTKSVETTGFEVTGPSRRLAVAIQEILQVDTSAISIGSWGPTYRDKLEHPLVW
jgi:adenylosuccinate synthase